MIADDERVTEIIETVLTDLPRFMDVDMIGELFHVHQKTVKRWLKDGRLSGFKPGREPGLDRGKKSGATRFLVSKRELARFIASSETTPEEPA